MSSMFDEETETATNEGQEHQAQSGGPGVVIDLDSINVPYDTAAIKKGTPEQCKSAIRLLVESRRELMGRVELSNHEEVRCASTWQGLWSFCRPQTFEGVTEYNDRFWEISMNLKGAVSGCMGNGGEGRLGKKLVELMCALDRKNRKARVMVDVDPRRLGARNEYNNKFAIGTNITTDELIEAIWELGQVEEYGGLKHFKVEEVKGGDCGTQRRLWLLSESGLRQTIWAEATWMMQAGVYVHGYGAAAFGAGGEGAAFIRYALGNVRVPENGARPIREMPGTVRVQVRFPMEMAHEVERKVAAMTKTAEKDKTAFRIGETGRRCSLVKDDLFYATKVYKELHKGKVREQESMGKGVEKLMQQMRGKKAAENERAEEAQEARLAAERRAEEAARTQAETAARAEAERKEMQEEASRMHVEARAAAAAARAALKEMANAVRAAEVAASKATAELDEKVSRMAEETVKLLMRKCAETSMLRMEGGERRTPQLEMTPTKAADEAGENANERAEGAAKAAAAEMGEKVEKLAVEATNAARAAVQIKHHRAEERRALKGVEAAGVGGTRKVLGG